MKKRLKRIIATISVAALAVSVMNFIPANLQSAAAEKEEIIWIFEPEEDISLEKNKTYYYTDTLSETSTGAENELTIITTGNANSKDKLDAANKRIAIVNAESTYITYTPSENGQLIANVKGMDIREVTDTDDVVIASNMSTSVPSDILAVCSAGTTYKIITNSTKYGGLYSLKFIPGEVEATPAPTQVPTAHEYQSPSTAWDFDTYAPSENVQDNIPYVSGTAIYDDVKKEIKLASDTTQAGYLTLNFNKPIANNVNISFDFMRHVNNIKGQHLLYKIVNSAGEEIVVMDAELYSSSGTGISVCGVQIATDAEFKSCIASTGTPTTIKTSIDYNAGSVSVMVGEKEFKGVVSGGTIKDIALFEISSTRSSAVADRYLSVDNLIAEEFVSTATPAPESEFIKSFEKVTINGISGRVNAPSDFLQQSYPVVVFLHGESRVGNDNESQLYEAQTLFEELTDKAVLIAPQTDSEWVKDDLKAFIEDVKDEYNASDVVLCGYLMGADTCWSLASEKCVGKVVSISGSGASADIEDIKKNGTQIWAFNGYNDSRVKLSETRALINALQTSGIDTMYTEYPMDGGNIYKKAESENGLADWILGEQENKKVVDLVLFAGQSNMAGRGDYENATVCPSGQGYEFHSVTEPLLYDGVVSNVLSTVNEPFGKNENNSVMNDNGSGGDRRNGDMVSSVMKAYYDKTGVPIVGVQASRGGQKTDYFMSDSVMTEMQNRYNAAQEYLEKSGYTVRRNFVVWCQGCSDADSKRTAQEYKANLLSIFNSIKSKTNITDMFIVQIGHRNNNTEMDAYYKIISDAQGELAEETDNIYAAATLYTDEYFALMRDNYHYYQEAYNKIGTEAGEEIAEVYEENSTEPTQTPQPSVTPEPDYSVTSFEVKDGKITAVVTSCDYNIQMYIAQYDENGRLLKVECLKDVTVGENYISSEAVDSVCEIKVMIWRNMEPECCFNKNIN